MAGFEFARAASIAEIARESRIGRYLPLYLAGLALGAAIGLGISFSHSGASPAKAYVAPPAPASAPVALGVPASAPVAAAGQDVSPALPDLLVAAPIVDSPLPAVPVAPTEAAPVPTLAAAMPAAPTVVPAVPAAPTVAPTAVPTAPPAPAAPAAANPPAVPAAAPVAAAAPAKPNFYVPAVSSGGPTTLEQQLFDGINSERAKAGLVPYTYDAGLTKIARTRSQQMADQNYFNHVDPYGYTMYTALLSYFGYTSYNWAGENLAMNNYPASEAASRALTALMNSPTHRDNILYTGFSRLGVGEVTTSDGRHIFSMIFLG